jgi:hypothetical protein
VTAGTTPDFPGISTIEDFAVAVGQLPGLPHAGFAATSEPAAALTKGHDDSADGDEMQPREYRASPAWTLFVAAEAVVFLAMGLFMITEFFLPPQAGTRPGSLVLGLIPLVIGAAAGAEAFFGRKLLVTDDGLRGFVNFRRLVIPWSSVRSFTVEYERRSHTYVARVTLDNGEQVSLMQPRYRRERVERFVAELTEALREHHEQAR